MPYCYYTCNLLPLDLVARAGYSPRWLGSHLLFPDAPSRRDALSIHPMTCPYVTKLAAAAEGVLAEGSDTSPADCLVVPGGCDAMRRLGDLLVSTFPDKVFVLTMPRSSGPGPTATLAEELAHLDHWLGARLAAPERLPNAPGAVEGAPAEPPAVDYPVPPSPGGVFLVTGPLSDDSLLALVHELGSHVSGLESCTSPDRWKALAPGTGPEGDGSAAASSGQAIESRYETLAAQVLAAGVCPRRSTVDRRDYLVRRLDETQPASIIYARQSFCDPGAYDALLVAELAHKRGLPYLELEVDFPFDAGGPLRTRVEAFLEAQMMEDDLLGEDDLFTASDAGPHPAGPHPAGPARTGSPATPATEES